MNTGFFWPWASELLLGESSTLPLQMTEVPDLRMTEDEAC